MIWLLLVPLGLYAWQRVRAEKVKTKIDKALDLGLDEP